MQWYQTQLKRPLLENSKEFYPKILPKAITNQFSLFQLIFDNKKRENSSAIDNILITLTPPGTVFSAATQLIWSSHWKPLRSWRQLEFTLNDWSAGIFSVRFWEWSCNKYHWFVQRCKIIPTKEWKNWQQFTSMEKEEKVFLHTLVNTRWRA